MGAAAILATICMVPQAHEMSQVFIELGLGIVGLALLARFANRLGFSAIPLYLLFGLAFGNGGLVPLNVSKDFTHVGAEMGVLLLLFMLGLEYTGEDLKESLRTGLPSGLVDFALNFPPGVIAGLLLRWGLLPSVLLGGVTYISSSGIIARVLAELKRLNNTETPSIITVLVLEDLAMAVYLPLMAVLLVGGGAQKIIFSVFIALVTVVVILLVALRYGRQISKFFLHESDEIILLTTFGAVLLVGGLADRLQVSAAIGAFLVGIALSGPIAEKSQQLLAPLRDLFAAVFFSSSDCKLILRPCPE
jgi:CPA2 family monovalent cation:H+ antiporter-2